MGPVDKQTPQMNSQHHFRTHQLVGRVFPTERRPGRAPLLFSSASLLKQQKLYHFEVWREFFSEEEQEEMVIFSQ